jgi:CRP-like cAMP-binding protein/uncharacterized protein (UPF0335 family)
MSIQVDSTEGDIIRQMIPFSTMANHTFRMICRKIEIENIPSGAYLFKRGDAQNDLIYLLKGLISLESGALKVETIAAGSDSAQFAIAHQLPRKIDAIALEEVHFLRLDAAFIGSIGAKDLQRKDHADIQRAKQADNEDCKSTLLMIPIIRGLSPLYLHKVADALEAISVEKNEVILKQGTLGKYFYLISKGECLFTYKNSEHASAIHIEKKHIWQTFGEMALILNEPCNETVTALSKMVLLQIRKDKFIKLIKEPSLTFIDFIELELWQDKGAILLDVRSADEYEDQHLSTALNVPLFSVSMHLRLFAKNQHYIIICTDGKESEAAAFLMKTQGFDVKIIRNGLNHVPKGLLSGINGASNDDTTFAENLGSINPEAILDADNINDVLRDDNRLLIQSLKALKVQCERLENEKKELKRSLKRLSARLKSV